MKTRITIRLFTAVFLFSGTIAVAGIQNDPVEEVPGDNFSLEGALELFKKSASPQEFEQLLNSPDSKVNNLDLNGDGDIDYIRVIDRNEGNVHAFVMQAVISRTESQDIAVIELEKRSDGTAVLQIVGDADIYGIETIIEPTQEVRVNAGTSTARTVVNVWTWPSVQYVYSPYYTVWVSPWSWSYYPGWYRPWRPIAWHVYDPYWAVYRPYYSYCYRHRVVYAPRMYRPYRTTSVIVYNRHSTQINHYRSSRSNDYAHGYRNDRSGDYRGSRRYDSDRNDRNGSTYDHNRRNGSRYDDRGGSDHQRSGRSSERSGGSVDRDPNSTIERQAGTQRTSRFGDNPQWRNERSEQNRGMRQQPTTMNRERSNPGDSRQGSSQRSNENRMRSMPSQNQHRSVSPGGGGSRQPSKQRSGGGGQGGGGRSGGESQGRGRHQ